MLGPVSLTHLKPAPCERGAFGCDSSTNPFQLTQPKSSKTFNPAQDILAPDEFMGWEMSASCQFSEFTFTCK